MAKGFSHTRRLGYKGSGWGLLWRSPMRLGLLVAVLLLVACGAAEQPTATPSVPATPSPRVGGTVVASSTHPQSLNPILTPVSTTIFTTPLIYNGLTRPGDGMEPLPDLAGSWDISADGLTFTFHLRNGVKWHDGQPFTARDVKYSWEATCHPDNTTGRQICGFFSRVKGATDFTAGKATEIAGIKVLDDQTVQVEMTAIYAPFLTISAGQMIIPKHIWESVPVKEHGAHPAS